MMKDSFFYNKGVLETVMKLGWQPDIIHCHDWPAGLIPLLVKTKYKDVDIFKNTKIVYNLHHPENLGIFEDSNILDLLGLPEDVEIDKLSTNGKYDLLRIGLMYSDHVVTGNHLSTQFDDLFKELNINPTKIQGSPEDVSTKFADYYKEIAGNNE
jgi:starch synthase